MVRDDIMTIVEAELGDPKAGFYLLRKMVDAALGEYEPSQIEQDYFRRCRDAMSKSKRPLLDPKQIQRSFARSFNLVRKRGNQRKDVLDVIAVASILREVMKSNGGNEAAAIEIIAKNPSEVVKRFGYSPENLKRLSQRGNNTEIAHIMGWKKRRPKSTF